MTATAPAFHSRALDAVDRIDHADVQLVPLPPDLAARWQADPAAATRAIFDLRAAPLPIRALFGLRQGFVRLLGIGGRAEERHSFDVHDVEGGEALIRTEAPHLLFCAGVAVSGNLLRLTTVVQLHGRRGRLYFAPVQWAHGPVALAMMKAAARHATRSAC